MKTIALIEDVNDHREIICRYLADNYPDLPIVGEARTVPESYDMLNRLQPDILISDIQLMRGTSFDALARLDAEKKPMPFAIFVTGHGTPENITRAMRFMAIDFIEKPVGEDLFCAAVNEAIRRIDAHDSMVEELRTMLMPELTQSRTPYLIDPHERIVIKLLNGIRRQVSICEILYFRADRDMTTVHLTTGEVLRAVVILGHFKKLLRGHHDFLLAQHGCLVNAYWIRLFNLGDNEVILNTPTRERIALSRPGTNVMRDYLRRKEEGAPAEQESHSLLKHLTRLVRGKR